MMRLVLLRSVWRMGWGRGAGGALFDHGSRFLLRPVWTFWFPFRESIEKSGGVS